MPGASGRRVLRRGALLAGCLLLVLAPILRFWVTPLLAQSPQDPGDGSFVSFTSTGTISTLFDLQSAADLAGGQPLEVTRTLATRGDAAAARAAAGTGLNVAVAETLDQTLTADGTVVAQTQFRLAADRHTQALVDCCDVQVGGISVPMAGAGNPLRLPWFTPAAPYPYFDTTLLAPVDLDYIGTDQVADITAMKFQQATAPTELGTVPAPGDLVGSAQMTVPLHRTYTMSRSVWVDPTTGIILRTAERVRETLRDDTGKDVVVLLVMTLVSTPEQEATQVRLAHEQGRPVLWTHTYAPTLCLIVGAVLVVIAAASTLLGVRRRRAAEEFPDEWATFDDLKETFG